MKSFSEVYRQLNAVQKQAVDTVYGPVLVIAGPGTGKTQLLSARVARILQLTDVAPQNILCLTFTESGAMNMRERLTSFIGQSAYEVNIGTYHAFGSTIISRYPEYFTDLRLERPIDELGKRQILADILENVDYRSPIKQVRHHLGDLVTTISEVKRGLLAPDDLRKIADSNLQHIAATKDGLSTLFAPYANRLPGKLLVATELFGRLHKNLSAAAAADKTRNQTGPSLLKLAAAELATALETADADNSTKPLTAWKNHWLVKDDENNYVLAGELEAKRMTALADVLTSYQTTLAAEGLYDFDDMILRAIDVLAHNDCLRFTLQEQYQFILLDEFQDTNAAQLKLIELLTDNPANEGEPNVLAVGDDDQAIYAFQGAEASNMLDFHRLYGNVTVLSLSDNYRSRSELLAVAENIAAQIDSRLHKQFSGVSKTLAAKNTDLPATTIRREIYVSSVAERTAVAEQIAALVASGVSPSHIAVLAPKHRYLEPLVPYLQHRALPVSYEKRENILEARVVRELLTMSKLILALHHGNHVLADSFWPEVLSYDFWDFSVSDIWKVSWQANDNTKPWSELLIDHPKFKHAALLMLTLAGKIETESAEFILDALIGTTDVQTHDRSLPSVRSPLRDYYLRELGESTMYETVSQLTVLRSRMRDHQQGNGFVMKLPALLEFVGLYEAAEQPMLHTNPYSQAVDAVQLMTVFKAKGLEFDHVFLVACDDSVWGSRATGIGNKLTLPANLAHIRHAGSTDDERLRLLYVALTRARSGIHLTSHQRTFSGKSTEAVKYFDEMVGDDGRRLMQTLPKGFELVRENDLEQPSLEALTLNWRERHTLTDTPLKELLRERLKRYQLSPTHLTQFLDLRYGGPESFLLSTLLRFKTAPSVDAIFGNAMHDTLQWVQNELNIHGRVPSVAKAYDHAEKYLRNQPLLPEQFAVQADRARHVLDAFLKAERHTFKPGNVAEKPFHGEGVFLGPVHMGGKVDLLDIDADAKRIRVVDYKTGHLGSDPAKLRRYSLQLYCYKLLVEGSKTYRSYTVDKGTLLFIEPDGKGNIVHKDIIFDEKEVERTKQLLHAMWQCVTTLDLPDISSYQNTPAETRRFEDDLLDLLGDARS